MRLSGQRHAGLPLLTDTEIALVSAPALAPTAERLRESLLFHGLASEALAAYADVDSRTAYSAGLLRGIGIMVLDRAGRLRVTGADVFDPQRFAVYGEWEKARFGVSGVEVSAIVMEEWRFPADLVNALRSHLLPAPGATLKNAPHAH